VSAKLSLAIGVKYYSFILSLVIASSLVFWGATKNVVWKYCFSLALLLLALVDNMVALLSVGLSILAYQLKFRADIETAGVKNQAFRAMVGAAIFLMCIVYYHRLVLGYESAVATINFQEYQSWKDRDLFYEKFCEGNEDPCLVDQSVFFVFPGYFGDSAWCMTIQWESGLGRGFLTGLWSYMVCTLAKMRCEIFTVS